MIFGKPEDTEKINPATLFKLNQWLGNDATNLKVCLDIEEALLAGVPKKHLIRCLYYGINMKKRYIKFPKVVKLEGKYDWLKPYFCRLYKLGSRELDEQWELIVMQLDGKLEDIALLFGLCNKDRRKLGLSGIKFEKYSKPVRTLMDY